MNPWLCASMGFATLFHVGASHAQGIIGGMLERSGIPIVRDIGREGDNASREIQRRVPPIGEAARQIDRAGQYLGREVGGLVGGPVLAEWIRASRRNVIGAGVRSIPPQIQQSLVGFFPAEVLQSVRYRSGWGNEVALPSLSFRFGDAAAITLDDIVMFRDENEAQQNVGLWAHELSHVLQYRRWGINDFAARYVRNAGDVENEAEQNAQRFVVWYQNGGNRSQMSTLQQQSPPLQNPNFPATFPSPAGPGFPPGIEPLQNPIPPQMQASMICRIGPNACWMNMPGTLGSSCVCFSPMGPMQGMVSPN